MCISQSGQVIACEGGALVRYPDCEMWLNARACPEGQVGDYMLAHASLILSIIPATEVPDILQAHAELHDSCRGRRADEVQNTPKAWYTQG